jgi:excisionase family DNA binding protein
MTDHTLRTDEAARYVGLAKPTLEKLRWRGAGPRFLRLGRAVRYLKPDLDTWLEACARRSTSDLGKVA